MIKLLVLFERTGGLKLLLRPGKPESCGLLNLDDRCFKKFQTLETLCSKVWNTLFHYLEHFVSRHETLCSNGWNWSWNYSL